MRLLVLLSVAVIACACAANQPCCDSRLRVTPGARYLAFVPNPDGGTSTTVELVLTSAPSGEAPGEVTVKFQRDGREVSQRFSAARHFF